MEPLLYLTHRLPYPPNKGDKIRSYHLLRYLSQHYRVFLGSFIDDERDAEHLPAVRKLCGGIRIERLHPGLAKLVSLRGLISGEALTLPYYRNAALARWVDETVREFGVRKAVLFSSPMAQYTLPHPELRVVADFCDVDSAKWTQYADTRPWPLSWVYRREGQRLLQFERRAARSAAATVFVTAAEAQLFAERAPESGPQLRAVGNGVDSDYFAPLSERESPFRGNEIPVVFTGAMDYWPNIDAVIWFATEILPRVRAVNDQVHFYVVGMNPAPAVTALAQLEGVTVTGRVPDVRPYLQHARVVVAPLRIARGVQNKALEAMAMARPVVVTAACAAGIGGAVGREYEAAADALSFAQRVLDYLDPLVGDAVGQRARRRIRSEYSWDSNLSRFGALLEDSASSASARLERRALDGLLAAEGARG
jgi:sugar transferase (PEP-CTERM/EpsH1 system associated)